MGSVFEMRLLNIEPKKRSPPDPPGISARIIRSSVITWATANTTVNAVLWANIAKYRVAVRLPA